jgi:hypothetical protein
MGNQITAARAISGLNHFWKSCSIKHRATGNPSRAANGSGDPCGAQNTQFGLDNALLAMLAMCYTFVLDDWRIEDGNPNNSQSGRFS